MNLKLSQIKKWLDLPLQSGDDQVIVKGISTDTRTIQPGEIFIPLSGKTLGSQYNQDALDKGAVAIIETPCNILALKKIAQKYLETFPNLKVIGITGSVGKTSSKDMLNHLLSGKYEVVAAKESFNNEIGVPLTIFRVNPDTQVLILELGAYKVGDIKELVEIAPLDFALITKVSSAHFQSFGTLDKVYQAKTEIVDNLKTNASVFVPNDDPKLFEILSNKINPDQIHQVDEKLNYTFENREIVGPRLKNLPLLIAVAKKLGLTESEIQEQINNYHHQSKHRLQIFEFDNWTLVDDAYNANPDSFKSGLEFFYQLNHYPKKIGILGDMLELGSINDIEHQNLAKELNQIEWDQLYYLGENFDLIQKNLSPNNQNRLSKLSKPEEIMNILDSNEVQNAEVYIKASYSMGFAKTLDQWFEHKLNGKSEMKAVNS